MACVFNILKFAYALQEWGKAACCFDLQIIHFQVNFIYVADNFLVNSVNVSNSIGYFAFEINEFTGVQGFV